MLCEKQGLCERGFYEIWDFGFYGRFNGSGVHLGTKSNSAM